MKKLIALFIATITVATTPASVMASIVDKDTVGEYTIKSSVVKSNDKMANGKTGKDIGKYSVRVDRDLIEVGNVIQIYENYGTSTNWTVVDDAKKENKGKRVIEILFKTQKEKDKFDKEHTWEYKGVTYKSFSSEIFIMIEACEKLPATGNKFYDEYPRYKPIDVSKLKKAK